MEAETGVKKRKPRSGGATRQARAAEQQTRLAAPGGPAPAPEPPEGALLPLLPRPVASAPRGPSEPAWVAVGPSRVCPAA